MELIPIVGVRAATYLTFAFATIVMGFFVLRAKNGTRRLLFAASSAFFLLGSLLFAASWLFPETPSVSLLSMVVLASYCAIAFTAWVNEAVRLERGELWIFLISSSILSAAIHFLCVSFIGETTAAPIFAVLSTISLLMLFSVAKGSSKQPSELSGGTDPQFVWQVASEKGLIVLYLGALGFVSSVSRMALGEESILTLGSVEMISVVLAGIVLFLALFVIRAKINSEEVILCLIPIVGLLCLCIPLTDDSSHLVIFGAATTAFTTGLMLLQVICREYGRGNARKALVAYNLLAGCVCVLNALGFYALDALSSNLGLPEYMAPVFICLFVLLLALLIERLPFSRSKLDDPAADFASGNDAIEELGHAYNLTSREKEVLELMAYGRNIPAIAKMLYVSESTVRTHNKHIFKKMGVHTRQECLDAVAAAGKGSRSTASDAERLWDE